MKKIKFLPKSDEDPRIIQIYRKGLEYAFYSPKNQQCNAFIFCKDFLQDVIQANLYQRKLEIYKFTYNPETDPEVGFDKLRLLLTNSKDKDLEKRIPACLDFIHQVEKHLKIKKTTVKKCSKPPKEYEKCGVWAFDGSKRWLMSPPMLSLYTLMLRVGFVHKLGNSFQKTLDDIEDKILTPYQTKDQDQLFQAKKGINIILEKGDKKIFSKDMKINYPDVEIETMHHLLGIVAFTNQLDKKYTIVPTWFKNLENL